MKPFKTYPERTVAYETETQIYAAQSAIGGECGLFFGRIEALGRIEDVQLAVL